MQIKSLAVLAFTGLILSGCSLWTKSDNADAVTDSAAVLRSTPQQSYQFDGQSYDVEIYDSAAQYSGYEVEFYDPSQYYYYGYNDVGVRPFTVANASNPRDAAFVKLNGDSQNADWRQCERQHNGYLLLSEYDLRLDPGFEVCMRNKGYVLASEVGSTSGRALSAQSTRLRGGYPQTIVSSTSSAFYR